MQTLALCVGQKNRFKVPDHLDYLQMEAFRHHVERIEEEIFGGSAPESREKLYYVSKAETDKEVARALHDVYQVAGYTVYFVNNPEQWAIGFV